MNDKLKQLILENPGLPLIVSCGEEANTGEYSYEVHFDYKCGIAEYAWFNNKCFNDDDDLINYIIEDIMPDNPSGELYTQEEMEQWAKNYIKEHNIKFQKYIEVTVG